MSLTFHSSPPPSPWLPSRPLHGATALPRLGVIRAEGEEAAKFLHAQLSQDFALLGLSEARLAGYCSAKGRLLASFIGFKRSQEEIVLVCAASVLPATLKRLSMFVLRAKVRLSDASAEFALRGLVGDAVPANLPQAPWSKLDGQTQAGATHLVRLYPGAGQPRALWLAPAGVDLPAGSVLESAWWDWLDVMAGVPLLSLALVEAFVPQMLNLESVGGVNFKKGCYPGQEVVARSQFRGTLKRRAYLVLSSSPLTPGQEVFHESDSEQPCGTVVAAAASPEGGWSAMVSMQTSSSEGGKLHLGAAGGPVLSLLPLPYPLLADV